MKWFEKIILTNIFKTYKSIKNWWDNKVVYPIQYAWWTILRWYYTNIYGGLRKMRSYAVGKIITYVAIIILLLLMLKHTEYIFYEPDAYYIEIKWPKRIKRFRKYALVHWISFIIIYTFFHLVSWLNWRIHEHFKNYGQTLYIELWYWYSMWFHGMFWTAVEKYLNYGSGWTALLYFTIINHFLFLICFAGEFLEDMEYDWDDYHDSYEGALKDPEGSYYTSTYSEDTREMLRDREQTILDSVTWDVFGTSMVDDSEDPDKVQDRWHTWDLLMYPPVTNTDEENEEEELQMFVRDEPWDLLEAFQEEQYLHDCDPTAREWWWEYWTVWHHEIFIWLVYPWFSPIRKFYLTTVRPLHVIPGKRIRAVGEYSRYNWRYKVFLFRFDDIPEYEGFGEYTLLEIIAATKFIYYIFRAIFLYWIRGLRNSRRDWKGIWFRKKCRRQLKKLRKWGSINYSFFGKKNYKPKK
jgi:hypothetical protein